MRSTEDPTPPDDTVRPEILKENAAALLGLTHHEPGERPAVTTCKAPAAGSPLVLAGLLVQAGTFSADVCTR